MPLSAFGHQHSAGVARASTVLSIQYLRGAAAAAVVLSHIGGHTGLNWAGGAAGVDVFFVISGFIIWTVTAGRLPGQNALSPAKFMIDRVTRIAPPYVLLTLVVYLGARFIPGAFPNMKTSLPHALLSAAFIPHISPQGTTFPQVIPGWTLNYEIFFYVIFALCLGCAPRLRLIVLTALLTGLAAASFVLPITNTAEATYTDPLLLEFVAGLWLGAAWQHRVLPSTVWGYAALAAGIGGFAVWQSLSSVAPEHSRCLVWGIPAALVVAGAVTIEARRGMPTVPPLLVLGDASFSIYLVNVFVVAAVWRLMERAPVPLYCTAAMIATAVIGIVFWRAVERPLTRAARHWVHRPAPGPTQVAILHPVLQEGG